MTDEHILNEIIVTYRKIIDRRYQYDNVSTNYDIPNAFTKDQIEEIRHYFLSYIYPDLDKRNELNSAFESLDGYIKNPSKLLQLLIDSAKIIFKYGKHLPKIFGSGMKALRSFREASKFEKHLVEQAKKGKQYPEYDESTIYSFIKELPRENIDQFINSSQSLFKTFHDTKLVVKIIEIMSFLILKMKDHPNIYSKEEITGLQLGRELIEKGNDLFKKFSQSDQEQLINFIAQVEKDSLDEIYGS